FADQEGHDGPLTMALATRWAQHSAHRTRLTWARRLQVVRPFARYLAQFDPGTAIIPTHLFGPTGRRLVPHIYTDTEVAALLQAAAQLRAVAGLRLRPRTYVTLFGLLASTGLRLGEALTLHLTDVDLPNATLTVRQTKCRKSRLVPLHPTTVSALSAYVTARGHGVSDPAIDTFLISDRGRPLDPRMAEHTFAILRTRLGWIGRGGYPYPRIHDLRHSYVCRALLRAYQERQSVEHVMDVISTYVGHARIANTYWYVTAVPELVALAGARFAAHAERGDA
ncbi:MAG: tyrosine-type recombinase/integrase, partial [Gemmatimonadales bacterium]